MRTEPPAGDDFERMIVRITENVLLAAGSESPAAETAPKPRLRFGAISIVVLVVLGLGAAGGALAIGFGNSPWGTVEPTATTSTTPAPSRTPQPTPTATTPAVPVVPAVPAVAIGNASFSPPSWGAGISVTLSGFAPNTDFALTVDTRYAGESKTPDGYFSEFSTPLAVTTDDLGAASVTWIPDSFPQNFTGSGESGYALGSYVRVDTAPGPQRDPSGLTDLDPVALSGPLSISYRPVDEVSVNVQACIEPDTLVAGQAGLPVALSGLVPGELVFLTSFQTGDSESYSFQSSGPGIADNTGSAVVVMNGNTSMYPVSTSAMIAPSQWRVRWSGSYRATPSEQDSLGSVPLTIGGCG
jgi:hypothetical protein